MVEVIAKEFGVQFKEAISYLRNKLPEATLKHDDLAGPVNSTVFAVAGATKADLLGELHKSLVTGLEKGTTITQFRKDFDASVQKNGWAYKGKRGWRTAVIFNNNMRAAHMAGRWVQLQANKDNRPYLQYRTAGDSRVRPQHKAWNGLIFHIDDSFWLTHYPPNGYGCRCTIRAYSNADIDTLGVKPSPPFKIKTRRVVSQDGEITDEVPNGIDPGWDHNVGRSWIKPEVALGEKIARLPSFLQGPMVDKTITPAFQKVLSDRFKAFRDGIKRPSGTAQIVGFLDNATLSAITTRLPDTVLNSTAVMVVDNKTAHITGSHKATSAPQQVWPDDWIDSLPENFRNYRAVLLDKDNNNLVFIPQGSFNATLPKIVLRLNQKTKYGNVGSIISLGSAKAVNLKDQLKYELLLGSL